MAQRKSWELKWFLTEPGSSLAQCTYCKEEIDIDGNNTAHRLKTHLYNHGIINESKPIPLSLQTHYTNLGGYKALCIYCKQSFSYRSASNLHTHLKRCEKLTKKEEKEWVRKWFPTKRGSSLAQCTYCKEEINIDGNNTEHRLKTHLYIHGIIDESEPIPLSLQTHFTNLGGYKALCIYCKGSYSYKSKKNLQIRLGKNLQNHLRICKNFPKKKKGWVWKWFSIELESSLVKCTRCNEKFNKDDITPLKEHLYKHGITEKSKKLPLSLQKHFTDLLEFESKARCNYCGKVLRYTCIFNLKMHLNVHLKKLTSHTQREYASSTTRSMDCVINPHAEHQSQELFGLPNQLSEQTREGTSGFDGMAAEDTFKPVPQLYNAPSTSRSTNYVMGSYAEHRSQGPSDFFVQSSEQTREGTSGFDEMAHWMETHSEDDHNSTQKLYDELSGLMDSYTHRQNHEPPGFSVQLFEQTRGQTGDFDEMAHWMETHSEDDLNSTQKLYDEHSGLMDSYSHRQCHEPPGFSVHSSEQTREQTGDFDEMAAEDTFNPVPQLYNAPSTSRSTNYVMGSYAEHRSQGPSDFFVQSSEQTREGASGFDEMAHWMETHIEDDINSTQNLYDELSELMDSYSHRQSHEPPGFSVQSSEQTREQIDDFDE